MLVGSIWYGSLTGWLVGWFQGILSQLPGLSSPKIERLEPGKYTQQEKEKHLQTTNFWGSMLVFRDVSLTKVYI